MESRTARDFEAFYLAEFDRVVRAVYVVVGSREEAWDIAQEAFARTWANWTRIRRQDAPVVFVLAVARNLSKSHVRRLFRQRRVATELEGRIQDAGEHDALGSVLEQAVARLPPRQRWAVVLCDLLDLSSGSAGSIMRIAPSTVRVHLARARARLKEELGEMDQGDGSAVTDEERQGRADREVR